MSVRDTSREAIRDHRSSGKLTRQQQQVVDFLHAHPGQGYTRAELAHATGITLSAVCGRVNELVKLQRIVEPYRRRCTVTGKNAWTVRAVPVQLGLIEVAA
mgnify:CR=1 FL=1